MDCEQRTELLYLYALGALEGPEADELRAHLDEGCPRCEGRLAEARAMLSMLALSLPPAPPPRPLKNRLMARVAGSRRPRARLPRRRWDPAQLLLGAAAGIAIAALIFSVLLSEQYRQVAQLRRQALRRDARVQELESAVHNAQETIHFIESPAVQVAALQGTAAQPEARARVFLDPAGRTLRLYAANLKPLPQGRVYELWLISGDRKIPAGTFAATSSGESSLTAPMPPSVGPLAAIALTDEPTGGVPQPTGTIQLLGKL